MALINCKECGKEVSDKAINCPHCGYKMNKSEGMKVANGIAWMFIIFMIIMMILSWISF